jgi:hypothetical protein
MCRPEDIVWTDVSEECIASIFRVEKSACEKPAWASLQPPAHAGSSLADFSTLNMEAIRSFETSVHTRSSGRHIPEDGILHSLRKFQNKSPRVFHRCIRPLSICLVIFTPQLKGTEIVWIAEWVGIRRSVWVLRLILSLTLQFVILWAEILHFPPKTF